MTTNPAPREEPEPIEAEFEPATRVGRSSARGVMAAPVTRLESVGWMIGGALLGVLTTLALLNAGVGGSAAQLGQTTAQLAAGQTDLQRKVDEASTAVTALRTQLDAQGARATQAEASATSAKQQIETINRQLTSLLGASPDLAAAGGNPLARVVERLDTLESRLADDASAPRTTRQMQRAVSELSDQVEALDGASADVMTALNRRQSAMAALEQSVSQIEADLKDVEDRLAKAEGLAPQLGEVRKNVTDLAARNESARAPVLAAAQEAKLVRALGELSSAAEKGRPFASQQQTLAKLLPEDADILALREVARRGAPSLVELKRDFQDARRTAERAEAAAEDDGWNWLRGSLSGLVTVRRTNANDRTSTRIREASDALDAGDARAAVAAVDDLTGPAAQAFADWRSRAVRRADLDEQVAALNARLLRPADTTSDGG